MNAHSALSHIVRRRRTRMPRYQEAEAMTPFAQVLTDYMWNRRPANRPPMTTSILAAKLGVPRQSVNTWIYRGTVPPIETILLVLAQLDIPLRVLYDTYKRAGLSVPRFDISDQEPPIVQPRKPTSQRKQTRVPVPTNATDDEEPAPRPYVTPPPLNPAAERAGEWHDIIAQTTDALRARHMPEESIQAVIASLRDRQAGANRREHYAQAELSTEHTGSTASADDDLSSAPAEPADSTEPQEPVKPPPRRRSSPTK